MKRKLSCLVLLLLTVGCSSTAETVPEHPCELAAHCVYDVAGGESIAKQVTPGRIRPTSTTTTVWQ